MLTVTPQSIEAALRDVPGIDAASASVFAYGSLIEYSDCEQTTVSELITVDTDILDGSSQKTQNIWLNWGALLQQAPEMILSAIGAFTVTAEQKVFTVPLFALSIVCKFSQMAKVELRTEHCAVILALALAGGSIVNKDQLLLSTIELLKDKNCRIDEFSLDAHVAELRRLHCIDVSPNGYRLLERVKLF